MIITYIIASLFLALIAILFLGGKYTLTLKVKNSTNNESFVVEKKTNASGNNFLDWFYYDENGKEIKDENIKMMIFEAFSEEDWYGDYEFYTKVENKTLETVEHN